MNVGLSFFSLMIGIFSGIILAQYDVAQRVIPKVLHYIIYILLFFLGSKLGSSPDFIYNISTLGVQALIISICCAIGSCISAFFVSKVFFKRT